MIYRFKVLAPSNFDTEYKFKFKNYLYVLNGKYGYLEIKKNNKRFVHCIHSRYGEGRFKHDAIEVYDRLKTFLYCLQNGYDLLEKEVHYNGFILMLHINLKQVDLYSMVLQKRSNTPRIVIPISHLEILVKVLRDCMTYLSAEDSTYYECI